MTWATPCNNIAECYDWSDEIGCEFSTWLIPTLLGGAGAVLYISLFLHLYKSIQGTWKKIIRSRKSRLSIQRPYLSIESEKLYKTTVLLDSGDVNKIHTMFFQEVEKYGGQGGATCHLKVTGHLIKQRQSYMYNNLI